MHIIILPLISMPVDVVSPLGEVSSLLKNIKHAEKVEWALLVFTHGLPASIVKMISLIHVIWKEVLTTGPFLIFGYIREHVIQTLPAVVFPIVVGPKTKWGQTIPNRQVCGARGLFLFSLGGDLGEPGGLGLLCLFHAFPIMQHS